MNLENIKYIVLLDVSNELKEIMLIAELAYDEKVIPTIMSILEEERKNKKELILDMNAELSRAHVYIEMKKENKTEQKDSFNKEFVISEISKFYEKYKNVIGHCFNRFPKT